MATMHFLVSTVEQSQIGEARRQAVKIAQSEGCSEVECGHVAIVVTELATNLVRYAQQGEILIRAQTRAEQILIEIVSIDRGPGIANLAECLADGYSTGGTAGTGLGAVQRLCTVFDVYSVVSQGTVIYCLIEIGKASQTCPFHWAVINRPAPYELVSGDTWRISIQADQISIMIVDGLGHGSEAAAAAEEAALTFDQSPFSDLSALFLSAHRRMQGTRGGAMAAAQIHLGQVSMQYLGVGNISGSLRLDANTPSRGLLSHNGTLGVQIRKTSAMTYPCPPDSLLIMYSDGLQNRWSFDNYPGLQFRHPGIIAAVLYRDFCRGRDDVTVAVIRCSPWEVSQS